MTEKNMIIYVPGLGDGSPSFQRAAVWCWRRFGVQSTTFVVGWAGTVPFEDRLSALTALIHQKSEAGYRVSLVGASAGATAALQAFALQSALVARLVLVAGVANPKANVSPAVYVRNPVFEASMQQLAVRLASLGSGERRRIRSLYAARDPVVATVDSQLEGVPSRQLATVGHSLTIAYMLTFGARQIVHDIIRPLPV